MESQTSEFRSQPCVEREVGSGFRARWSRGEADEARVADEAVVGELGDLQHRLESRRDPVRRAPDGGRRRRVERAVIGSQCVESGRQRLEGPAVEDGPDTTGEV